MRRFLNSKVKKLYFLLAWLIILLGVLSYAKNNGINPMLYPTPRPSAGKTGKIGPHGGQIVTESGREYEVNVNNETGQLDVYSEGSPLNVNPPQNVGITLYKNNKTGQTIRLRAMNPPASGFVHYQGEVSPLEGPFMAFGLQFNLEPTPANTSTP